jgi:hypothetical protein
MGTIAAAVPLLPGKTDAWRQWASELQGPRAAEFADFNERVGLSRHAAWLQQTPMGDLVVIIAEGPGADTFFPKVAASVHEFDVWFRDTVREVHGVDFSNPPPLPELGIDARS